MTGPAPGENSGVADFDNTAGVFQGDVDPGSVRVGDDAVGFVENLDTLDHFSGVGIEQCHLVIVVDGHRDVVCLAQECDSLGVDANAGFAKFLQRGEIDDGDGAAVTVGTGQQSAILRDVHEAVGVAGHGSVGAQPDQCSCHHQQQ